MNPAIPDYFKILLPWTIYLVPIDKDNQALQGNWSHTLINFVCIIPTNIAWGKEQEGLATHLFPAFLVQYSRINGYPRQKG